MNPDLQALQPYPFEKLAKLKQGIESVDKYPIMLSMGEPQHPAPQKVVESLIAHLHGLSKYPQTKGDPKLRQAISDWLIQRFTLAENSLNADLNVLPVTGTREAIFALTHCLVDRTAANPSVLMPNPFYQIYEGAAYLAGAKPVYLNTTAATGFLPDLDAVTEQQWKDCQLFFLCSPGNPTGAVMDEAYMQRVIELSQRYDFVVAGDECYSEIYFDDAQPPAGLLGAAARMGLDSYDKLVVLHSLSKRSSLPGLRSGFVAGDEKLIKSFALYRTYHGCAMPPAHQAASITAWQDEEHVMENRRLYRQKFIAVDDILKDSLNPQLPDAAFYLWAKTPIDGIEFTRELYRQQNVTVVPGSFLSRDANGMNPGQDYVRMALVASLDECVEAAQRIHEFTLSL